MFWWCWWWRCCSSSELECPEDEEEGLSTSDTPESAGLGGREPATMIQLLLGSGSSKNIGNVIQVM